MKVPDNGPLVVGVLWSLQVVSGGFLGLRFYAKLSRRQRLWWDDYILVMSWIFLLIECSLIQTVQLLGFGKRTVDINPANITTITFLVAITVTASSFAVTLSKLSFGLTLLRLTDSYTRAFVMFCTITLFVFMLPAAVLAWIYCHPIQKTWDHRVEGECWDGKAILGYSFFNAAWSIFVDFTLALLPWKLIWPLQLDWKEKLGAGIAMSMGLLAGICTVVRGHYLIQLADSDFFYSGKDVTIWTAAETSAAIIGASIPVLRVFFKSTPDSPRTRTISRA
ncbi:hypothetical protein CC80DRAFT_361757, partial [Byssothecium circinans]